MGEGCWGMLIRDPRVILWSDLYILMFYVFAFCFKLCKVYVTKLFMTYQKLEEDVNLSTSTKGCSKVIKQWFAIMCSMLLVKCQHLGENILFTLRRKKILADRFTWGISTNGWTRSFQHSKRMIWVLSDIWKVLIFLYIFRLA